MVVKTEKGWVALRKDRFTYKVLWIYATRERAAAAVATAESAKAAVKIDDGNDHLIREFFWEEK